MDTVVDIHDQNGNVVGTAVYKARVTPVVSTAEVEDARD
jgi:hypothetical protein